MDKTERKVAMNWGVPIIGCIAIVVVALAVGALMFWGLWNWIAPVFWAGAPHLSIWQALGAWLLLSAIGGCLKASINRE